MGTVSVNPDTCPRCRHREHDGHICYNMASDNDCSCPPYAPGEEPKPGMERLLAKFGHDIRPLKVAERKDALDTEALMEFFHRTIASMLPEPLRTQIAEHWTEAFNREFKLHTKDAAAILTGEKNFWTFYRDEDPLFPYIGADHPYSTCSRGVWRNGKAPNDGMKKFHEAIWALNPRQAEMHEIDGSREKAAREEVFQYLEDDGTLDASSVQYLREIFENGKPS